MPAPFAWRGEGPRPGVRHHTARMRTAASCPQCDSPVLVAHVVCPCCGFELVEQRMRRGGRRRVRGLRQRRPGRLLTSGLAAAALIAAAAVGLVYLAPPISRQPPSDELSAAEAEGHLALRYPHLRYAEDAVIACPDRAIEPGGAARCWVLARVGLQRAVTVRLSERGNRLEFED
jgi:hypothetical protein